jgi:hypothetical protein
MSLASWKREFYRTPANKVSKKYALQHSLKKWVGLLPKNRVKHNVKLKNDILYDKENSGFVYMLSIDSSSCSLCECRGGYCYECPLRSCHAAYFSMYRSNRVMPMISLIKRAMKRNRIINQTKG